MAIPALDTLAAPALFALLSVGASYTDLRERMIPDWLNYGAVVAAGALAYFMGRLTPSYVAFVALAFGFAYAIYRLGAWAGGDVKFYTALLAFYPLLAPFDGGVTSLLAPLALTFMASAVLVVPVLLAVHAPSVWRERALFAQAAKGAVGRAARGAPLAAAAGVFVAKLGSPVLGLAVALVLLLVADVPLWVGLALAAGAFVWDLPLALPALGVSLLALAFIAFAQGAFGILAQRVLRRAVPLGELGEGAIPAQTLYLDQAGAVRAWEPPGLGEGVKRVLESGDIESIMRPPGTVLVDCLKARGVTPEEIARLRDAGITSVIIKESLPFAPVLALGVGLSIVIARGFGL